MKIFKTATVSAETNDLLLLWINRSIEGLWLLTIVLVPLAFLGRSYGEWSSIIGSYELPKITILRTSAGLIAILWLVESALRSGSQYGVRPVWLSMFAQPTSWPRGIIGWLSSEPTRWLTVAVILFVCSTSLSAALSTSHSTSLWGDIPGQDGYSFYTVISYCLLFGVIATHLKNEPQVWRLLGAIGLMGLLAGGYAVFQHYGWDFLDLIEPFGHTRSTSTFGRTIFAGSILMMTIPVTAVVAVRSLTSNMSKISVASRLAAGAIVLSVQILGIIFIASRGPWVGTIAGLFALLVLVAVFAGWRPLGRSALVLALGIALSVAVLVSPLQSVADEAAELQEETFQLGGGPSLGVQGVSQRLTSLSDQGPDGGLSGRKRIWGNAWELMMERPWFAFDDLSLSVLRPIVGYGPEQFRHTYLLVSPPNPAANMLPGEVTHSHNFFLHQGVETGFLGLAISAGLFLAVFASGSYVWLRQRHKLSAVHRLVLAGVLAILAGRLVEQMVGVARVSDLMVFWVLLAVFAALPVIFSAPAAADHLGRSSRPDKRSTVTQSRSVHRPLTYQRLPFNLPIKWLVVSGLVAGIVLLTWTKNINYVRSALILDTAAAEFRAGQLEGSLSSIGQSIDLSSDVSTNYERWSHVYWAHPSAGTAPQCEAPQGNQTHRLCLAQQAYALNSQWLAEQPFDFRSRLALADSAWDVSLLTGDTDLQDQSARLYGEAAAMVPNSWTLWNRVAEVLVAIDRPQEALAALDNSLAISGSSLSGAIHALRLQGISYRLLGQHQESLRSLDQALLLNPQHGPALLERSQTYYELGQANRAIEDLNQAVRFDSQPAEGFYRRGTIYYRIGSLQAAVGDLTQAIELDPQHADAFNNLGLAYTKLGSLEAAVPNFEQAISLEPDLAIAHNNLGFTLRDLGHPQQAIEALDQAIRLAPMLPIAYYNRALAYTLLGRDFEAERDGTRAVELGFDALSMNAAIDELKKRR